MEGLVYDSTDIDVRLDRVKNYLSITSASSTRRQNLSVNTGCTVVDTPISFCSFFIDNCIGSKYKEIVINSSSGAFCESPVVDAMFPLEGSLKVCYILFELFIATSENRVKINTNIKKLFLKYGFDLKLDLSDEKTIIHILDHLSRCYKWKGHYDRVSIEVVLPTNINSSLNFNDQSLIDRINIFKSRMNLSEGDASSFIVSEAYYFPQNVSIYFSHGVDTRWDRCFGETIVPSKEIIRYSDGMGIIEYPIPVINLTNDHAFIYVSEDCKAAMILPKVGPSLFVGVEEITTQTINMLYCGATSDKFGDHSYHVSLLPFYIFRKYYCSDLPWVKKLFDNVHKFPHNISVETEIMVGRLGLSASNGCEPISRNARHFDCEMHDKIYIAFLGETSRLIRAEISTTFFRGLSNACVYEGFTMKGDYLDRGHSDKLYCNTYMNCIIDDPGYLIGKAIPIDDSEEISSTSSEEEYGAVMPCPTSLITDLSSVEGAASKEPSL